MLRTKLTNVGDVWLDDSQDWLLWRPWNAKTDLKRKPVKHDGLLDRFGRIVTPENVMQFARQNGPLQICHHGVACFHNRPPPVDWFGMETYESRSATRWGFGALQERIRDNSRPNGVPLFSIEGRTDPDQYCLPMTWDENSEVKKGIPNRTSEADIFGRIPYPSSAVYAEPIGVWLRLVERVHSMLRIIAYLQYEQPGPDVDWQRLMPFENVPNEMTMNSRRYSIAEMINEWLRIGDVRPSITGFNQERSSVDWNTSLMGVLAVQLLGVFIKGSIAICSECMRVYVPIRAPKSGQNNYCPEKSCKSAASKYRKRKSERNKNANKK
jgi:hypothetical protein